MKKYEFTGEVKVKFGVTFKRIRALIDFGNVKKGELGGFIEKEENLSYAGNAWVYGDAMVYGNARVYGNAMVYGDAEVYGDAMVYGNARVYGNAMVYGNAEVYSNADYMVIGIIGSRFGFTTFFKNKNNKIFVSCGCFLGTLAEFRELVKEKHGTDTKFAKVYQAAADLAELQIGHNEKAD
jgi:hypothetical protein